MQLSKIKVAGFKSFVDPTTVLLPGRLIAVVGPNGCGKSNIIDAVTWVLGESSPKYLRGEALTDVIFNGSTKRKPVGQASVELIFDNSDGTLGGEYAQYAEISVKRSINRASDSTYYLNNARCRKRDIVNIFLGTGLGPRSYSIIGQNMITKIIDAKPDEMRTYLEEAAGISIYKERRHETQLRINHTKDNLTRVNDVKVELEKQLSHLKYQANAAEKYKSLKQQERLMKAEYYAIQWRALDAGMVDQTLSIQREETALEAKLADVSSVNRELEQFRHEQRVAQDSFQEVQRRYYAVGNEITRIEQDVLHHQQRQTQWETDLKQVEDEWSQVKNQLTEAEDEKNVLDKETLTLGPLFKNLTEAVQTLEKDVQQAEEISEQTQLEWDHFAEQVALTSQKLQIEKSRIQHLEENMRALEKRQKELQVDEEKIDFGGIELELNELKTKIVTSTEKSATEENALKQAKEAILTTKQAEHLANKELDQLRSELQKCKGELASLVTLQQTALGQRNQKLTTWLEKNALTQNPRLGQAIQVEKEWEQAVEKVLGANLQAVCVSDLSKVAKDLQGLQDSNVSFYATHAEQANTTKHKWPLLLDKVTADICLTGLLDHIYIAADVDEALTIAATLASHESVITAEGIWLNNAWIKILNEKEAQKGVLQREKEIANLRKTITDLEKKQNTLEKSIEERKALLKSQETEQDDTQKRLHLARSLLSEMTAHEKARQERFSDLQKNLKRNTEEQVRCTKQYGQYETDLVQAKKTFAEVTELSGDSAGSREKHLQKRDEAKANLQTLRQEWHQKKDEKHRLEVRLQTAASTKNLLQQQFVRLQNQLSHLNDRKLGLQSDLSSMAPIDSLKKMLSRSLDKHVSIESELNTARVAMESLVQEFNFLEEKRQQLDTSIDKIRASLSDLRVTWHTWQAKAEAIAEQIAETQFTLEDILKGLPAETSVSEWQGKLEQIAQRINRLGAINLAAIDEYSTCLERKQYLDAQIDDLVSGLLTLEQAIAKIDNETREKFKNTFDEVNEQLQQLFPTIFGGGKAYLELTNDNLLEAGVTMMACPPGKRNSSIYLLSGGEKTLTALALIFSLFYLNPAPFCMLDEVDAALDDNNVVRFSNLVKMMIDKTQFIFISHNKISIEMGDYLIGVTMQEPGVSRLVSVDVEKAISLAAS